MAQTLTDVGACSGCDGHLAESAAVRTRTSSGPLPSEESACQQGPLIEQLSRGGKVKVAALFQSGSAPFIEQEGLVFCSTYSHLLHEYKDASPAAVLEQMRDVGVRKSTSSAAAVLEQMREAGVDLQKEMSTCQPDCSSPKLHLLWERNDALLTPEQRSKIKCDAIILALLPEAWSVPNKPSQKHRQQQKSAQQDFHQPSKVQQSKGQQLGKQQERPELQERKLKEQQKEQMEMQQQQQHEAAFMQLQEMYIAIRTVVAERKCKVIPMHDATLQVSFCSLTAAP